MNSVIYQLYPTKSFHGDSENKGTNGLIMNGKCLTSVSLLNVDLTTDTLTFDVNADALIGEAVEDFRTMKSGDPMYLVASGGQFFYKWYLQTLSRVSRRTLRFVLTTGLGLLEGASQHMGGIYTGQTAKTVIDDIFSPLPTVGYNIASDVQGIQIYGHLPVDSRKANLARLLQAIGANIGVNGNNYEIKFESAQTTPRQIADAYVYEGYGTNEQRYKATAIEVTEHAFYALASDQTVVLFDNTAETMPASNQLVVFDEPCHDLDFGTLTEVERGANYAIVSGTGILQGKQYTHTQRVIKRSTGVTGPEHVVTIEDNELIGVQNSDYMASRASKYYAMSITSRIEAYDADGGIFPGMRVQFSDAFGDTRTGWVEKKGFELGNKTRAQMQIAVNWSPGPFGNNVDTYVLFDEAGSYSWEVPAGVTKIRLALGSGGSGGNGGTAGTDGSDGDTDNTDPTPGTGGSKGTAGSPGKIVTPTVEYTVTPGSTLTINVGAGGAGGAANGGSGAAGGHTTIVINGNTISSNSGSVQQYQNLFTGDVCGQAARDGFDGADGGSWKEGEPAEDVNAGDVVYVGGDPGASETRTLGTGVRVYMKGGGGSGAVYGHDGAAGGNRLFNSSLDFYGGDGGDAPTPDALPDVPTCSSAGAGGNGGGGGGAGGNAYRSDGNNTDHAYPGRGGYGSSGSAGKAGGDGFCLIMYKTA